MIYIGYKLCPQFDGDDLCKETPKIDDKALYASHFIEISR
jgi:hypothetical protein